MTVLSESGVPVPVAMLFVLETYGDVRMSYALVFFWMGRDEQ